MQGTAADLIKLAMLDIDKWIRKEKLKSRIILQVHDELVIEVPAPELDSVATGVNEIMSSVAKLKVPLRIDVGIGKSWAAAHA